MEALQQMLFNTAPLEDMPVQTDYCIKTYVIVDCASDEQHYKQLLSMDIPHAILYKDDDAKNLETVAPYLIELDPEQDYTQWLLNEHWGTHSVIYIKSHYAIEPLAEHFRRYTKVVVEPRENDNRNDETLAFFAFYDPRVLKDYFTVLTKEQMTEFCQPIICFNYEDEQQPDSLLTSYLKNSGEQWNTLVTKLNQKPVAENTDPNTEASDAEPLAELKDDIEVPIMPVILTTAQQDALDEGQCRKFCRQLLEDMQDHYNVSPKDIDKAIYYSKEADGIGLYFPATQSRYILTALLIDDSPIAVSKRLQESLKIANDEESRMQVLEQALEELTHKECLHGR